MTKGELFHRVFSKNSLLILLAAVAVSVAGFYFSDSFLIEKIATTEFVGNIQKVEGNTIYVKGLYVVRDKPELVREQGGFTQEVRVVVNEKTEIVKIVMQMPTLEELKKTNGHWDPNELPKEEQRGTLEDMTYKKQGLIIHVLTEGNIFKEKEFLAKRIEYVQEVYSDRPY